MLAKTPEDGANLMLSVALETGAMASSPHGWEGPGWKRMGTIPQGDHQHLGDSSTSSSILKGLVVCPYRDRYVFILGLG